MLKARACYHENDIANEELINIHKIIDMALEAIRQ